MSDKGEAMFRSFPLCLLVIAFVFSPSAISSAEPRDIHSSASEVPVNISRTPLLVLVKKGNFDGGVSVRATPVESIKFGKRELWLVRPATEFKDASEIIGYLNSIGLEPAGYHELLELAVQKPDMLKNGEAVYALGSPAELPSGAVSWQCYGMKDDKRFLSDAVDGAGWPINSYYLAKRKPAK
jgi:hypothetical protein